MKQTPMMQQYIGFKRQYPDKIVLFRMGDFYETFGEDAKLAAKVLNITLTTRDKASDPTPLAGFPHHALDQYLPKIIEAGHSAVIVDQLEDPKLAKGVVKRGVTRVVTPGTLDGELADQRKSSYVIALVHLKNVLGVALGDISTGEIKLTETQFGQQNIDKVVSSFDPSEALLLNNEQDIKLGNLPVQLIDPGVVKKQAGAAVILKFYGVNTPDSLALEGRNAAVAALAMLLSYIEETQKMIPEHINRPTLFSLEGKMVLDRATIRNLDLVQNSFTGYPKDSLIEVLDESKTRMGKRTLYSWILNPLLEKAEIESRHEVVESLLNNYEILNSVRSKLSEVTDIERIVGKIGLNRVNGRDLKALQNSLERISEISREIGAQLGQTFNGRYAPLVTLYDQSTEHNLAELINMVDTTIADSPPLTVMEGGLIKSGLSAEVDQIRKITGDSKSWLKEFVEQERARTGIHSLKISYNKVFGYYIDVTKAHQQKVPADYIRKQTLVNSERYITEELKQKEEIILGADEKLAKLEYEIFQQFRASLLPYLENLKILSKIVAEIDVLQGFAFVARNFNYVRPKLNAIGAENGIIKIVGGRHPVVERISQEQFITNDLEMSIAHNRMCVITGPNMSGKSTFIRQVALIVLMAQIGSFISATEAEITIVDRVFSRVGAADNLSQGRSTFMVEMEEAANILNNASQNSLIILDEVGRGTSTYDGVSIAWSLSEYLVSKIGARTLFATHYHELLKLAEEHPEFVKNYNVEVLEDEKSDDVVFLRKIVEGGTDKSYGIFVAKMAGLPAEVVNRAWEVLEGLSSKNSNRVHLGSKNKNTSGGRRSEFQAPAAPQEQLSFFGELHSELIRTLEEIDVDKITPVEALNLLSVLKKRVGG